MHCHKINTDTKSKETEIKRVIDVDRERVKKNRYRERQNEEKGVDAGREREMDAGEKGWMRGEVALHTAGILSLWD